MGGGVSFINSPESLVTEVISIEMMDILTEVSDQQAIDGLVMSHPGLCRLGGYPEVCFLVYLCFSI